MGMSYCYIDDSSSWLLKAYMQIALQGGLAVDIFFVLSGFLIAYILLKEFKKNGGKIDIFHFYLGRFLRLWPLMLVWATVFTLIRVILHPEYF